MSTAEFKDRSLIAVIGDEVSVHSFIVRYNKFQDSITGLLLAGVGHVNEQQKKNFLVVDSSLYRFERLELTLK